MNNNKYNALATECYSASKQKGWYDGYVRSRREALQLMSSEIAEATEAVRDKKPFVYVKSKTTGEEIEIGPDMVLPAGDVADWKPEGEGTELIDAAIRGFDLSGSESWPLFDPSEMAAVGFESDPDKMRKLKPLEFHYEQNVILAMFADPQATATQDSTGTLMSAFLVGIEKYVEVKGYDFHKIIQLKRNFNDTRSQRHGGKAL